MIDVMPVVRLRGHHLLCMLSYVGQGYSDTFTRNFDRCCAAIDAGALVLIVAGADDLCAPMLNTEGNHCLNASCAQRDRQALLSASEVLGLELAVGMQTRWTAEMIERMRLAFKHGVVRAACQRCEWETLCSDAAGDDFRSARLVGYELAGCATRSLARGRAP